MTKLTLLLCPHCGGLGRCVTQRQPFPYLVYETVCPTCEGRGQIELLDSMAKEIAKLGRIE